MTKSALTALFESMTPNDAEKARVKDRVMSREGDDEMKRASVEQPERSKKRRLLLGAAGAAFAVCLALIVAVSLPPSGAAVAYAISLNDAAADTVFKLADNENRKEDYGTSVSNVSARPELEFFIEGEDIAAIEISCETEYLYAADWTQTQERKYWGAGVGVDRSFNFFRKSITFSFDENFKEYGDVWYRWTAKNLQEWASEDNYSHILGGDTAPSDDMTPEELLALAAPNDGSPVGHIQLDGCPKELLGDRITITLTDRNGRKETRAVDIKISNNALKQTIVTATVVS